jgi:hypothetical protein
MEYQRYQPIPKPTPRRTVKGRKTRAEAKVLKAVREAVFKRDGGCRIAKNIFRVHLGPCGGPLQLAHLRKRSATRGMAPELRHRRDEAVCLCARHHEMEERHQLLWGFRGPNGADGLMRWWVPEAEGRS